MEALRNGLRTIARVFILDIGRRPLGIWLAWLALAYAALAQSGRLFMLLDDPAKNARIYSDALINWPIWLIAVIALIMRRHAAQLFGAIVCANLLIHTIYHLDWFGTAVGILGFIGLLVNRRWFVERLPNVW